MKQIKNSIYACFAQMLLHSLICDIYLLEIGESTLFPFKSMIIIDNSLGSSIKIIANN